LTENGLPEKGGQKRTIVRKCRTGKCRATNLQRSSGGGR